MWSYHKKLQYPVNIKGTDPKLAQYIVAQYGGPNGELAASLRYLSQRYSMPNEMTKALLTDIGLSAMILLLYIRIGKAYCFQYALPFSYTTSRLKISVLYVSSLPVDLYATLKLKGMSLSLTTTV